MTRKTTHDPAYDPMGEDSFSLPPNCEWGAKYRPIPHAARALKLKQPHTTETPRMREPLKYERHSKPFSRS